LAKALKLNARRGVKVNAVSVVAARLCVARVLLTLTCRSISHQFNPSQRSCVIVAAVQRTAKIFCRYFTEKYLISCLAHFTQALVGRSKVGAIASENVKNKFALVTTFWFVLKETQSLPSDTGSKYTLMRLWPRLSPDLYGGAYSALQPSAGFKGTPSRRRWKSKVVRKRKGKGGERKGEKP